MEEEATTVGGGGVGKRNAGGDVRGDVGQRHGVLHPRLSDRRHLRPYGQYWRPGPGEGACRAG